MKKVLFILFALISITTQAQVANGTETKQNAFRSLSPQTATTVNYLTTMGTDGTMGRVTPVNVTIPTVPLNYTVLTPTLGAHLSGIDTRLGQISSTTAGLTQRIYFTADDTTVNSVVYFASNSTGKGSTAAGSPPVLVLADNTKGYFTKDLISIPQPAATIGYAGSYSGNLTVSATPTPVATRQRFTVEVYRTNNLGTPIASGVSGAPVGDLGVTVIAILDSGELNINAGAITNVAVNGILTQNITINTGERLRYHVSAAKIGAGGGNVTFGVYYGSSYNSYYDVPVAITTDAVVNKSTVVGVTDTDALNTLNTGKSNDADVVHKTGSLTETVTGNKTLTGTNTHSGVNTFSPTVSASEGLARGTVFSPILSATNNNDTSIALDIRSTFNNGAFTNVSNSFIRISDNTNTYADFGYNTNIVGGRGYLTLANPTSDSNGSGLNFKSGSSNIGLFQLDGAGNFVFRTIQGGLYIDNFGSGDIFFRTGGSNAKVKIFGTTGNFTIQNGGTFTDAGYRLDVTGTTRLNGTATLGVTPTTSAGTYDILTRNTSTGVVEKVASTAYATTASPALTGTPTAPTATAGTNTTQIATTAFVQSATGNYKKYVALISQTGTNAPTETVLENTLGGAIVWTRNSAGSYTGTLTGVFTANKTYSVIQGTDYSNINFTYLRARRDTNDTVVVFTRVSGVGTDDVLSNTSIEIRVYP